MVLKLSDFIHFGLQTILMGKNLFELNIFDTVSPIGNLLYTLWSSVDFFISLNSLNTPAFLSDIRKKKLELFFFNLFFFGVSFLARSPRTGWWRSSTVWWRLEKVKVRVRIEARGSKSSDRSWATRRAIRQWWESGQCAAVRGSARGALCSGGNLRTPSESDFGDFFNVFCYVKWWFFMSFYCSLWNGEAGCI